MGFTATVTGIFVCYIPEQLRYVFVWQQRGNPRLNAIHYCTRSLLQSDETANVRVIQSYNVAAQIKTTKRGSPYLRRTLFNIMKVHLQRAPADEPVFQFLNKKRAEGKPYYVYMTAAGNKFLRRYYGKVMAYFSILEGLPPVDMDSTGLHHAE